MSNSFPQFLDSNSFVDVANVKFLEFILKEFKKTLKERKDSITKAAHILSINRSTLSMIVNDQYNPSLEMLLAMSKYMGKPILHLAADFEGN